MFEKCSSLMIFEDEPWQEDYLEKMNRFGIKLYTITHKSGDVNLKDDIRVLAVNDDTVLNYAGQEIPGYKLKSKSIEDKVISCYYNLPYKVTFKDAYGNIIKEELVAEGEAATAPEDPVKAPTIKFLFNYPIL